MTSMATHDEIVGTLTDLLRRHVGPSKPIRPEDHIQADLGLDSLAVMELVADAEERFDVSIPNEALSELGTVEDVAKAVARLSPGPKTA